MDGVRQKYPIGAFVKCRYDFEMIFPMSDFGVEFPEPDVYYGLIVEFEPDQYDGFSHWYDFYIVLCLDGDKRYFAESEIELVQHP